MIKQIWFIRNERKLFNGLCLAISICILLYAAMSALAISYEEYSQIMAKSFVDTGGVPSLFDLMIKRISLVILPTVSLVICIVLCYISGHVKSKKGSVVSSQIKRDLLIGTNFILLLILSFIAIDILSRAKVIQSFGLFPAYITAIGGVVFYFINLKKIFKRKQELN